MRVLLSLLALCGCADTGQPFVSYDAEAVVAPAAGIAAGDWTVTLDAATVAFGPLYLCAAASGSATLCETATGELVGVARIDLLDPARQPLGTVRGLESEVRSASFDYGIHWLLTEGGARAAPEAPGGHSAIFQGRAVRGSEVLAFEALVDVVASFQGQRAVPSVLTSGAVDETTERMEVSMDVGRWIGALDFDDVVELGGRVEPGSSAHNALVLAMTVNAPPELRWINEP